MKIFRKLGQVAVVGGALALVVACGSDDGPSSSNPAGPPGTATELPATDAAPLQDGECGRLPEGDVAEAIGPNDGGQHDYLLGGCVWTSTAGETEGLVEAIHATVLPAGQYEAVAEAGEPVSGFGDGATYADLHGELWFPCRSGDFCGIKANISDPDRREEVAMRLGKVLQGRV
ncbi:hypothetical protein [Micromonospora sp. NPDC051296]|uniref:hypothetical protein n=1 Tax=Micromonospora sp. NPDC051296 TaxID=3155046 RepID=UPI00342A11E8